MNLKSALPQAIIQAPTMPLNCCCAILPPYQVDLSTLSNLVAPRRPLKRNRKVVSLLCWLQPP
jgi:hypothetical protein